MAVELTPVTIDAAGTLSTTLPASADATGNFFSWRAGRFLEVELASGAVSPVDVTVVTPGQVRGKAIEDGVFTLNPGDRMKIPVGQEYRAAGSGQVDVTYADAINITVGVFDLPR